MARSRQERINNEVKNALKVLRYVCENRANGVDVDRLAEKEMVALERMTTHVRCFACGTPQTAPESVRRWEQDRLGSECRTRYAGLPWQEAIVLHHHRREERRAS